MFYLLPTIIMPNFDGTGPQGIGPNTGRGQGPCAAQNRGFGRGCPAQGRFGACRRFFGAIWPRGRCYDTANLEETEKALEEELAAVKKARAEQNKE